MRGVGFNTHGQWTLVLCAVSVLTLMGGVMVTRRRIETDTDLALHHTDAKLSSSMAVGLQPDKAGWHDSGVDRDCLQGCAAHGLICVEAGMNSHLHEVDTNAKLKAKVAAVGGTATAGACGSEFPNSRDVPAWSSEACYIPNGTRSAKIEDCAAAASPSGHGKRRLCYCSNKQAAILHRLTRTELADAPTQSPTDSPTNSPTETLTDSPPNAPTDSSTQHQQAKTPVFGFRVKVRFVADVDAADLMLPTLHRFTLYPLNCRRIVDSC